MAAEEYARRKEPKLLEDCDDNRLLLSLVSDF